MSKHSPRSHAKKNQAGPGGPGGGPGRGCGVLTSRHRAPALLEMYTFVLLAKFFPTEPKMQEE